MYVIQLFCLKLKFYVVQEFIAWSAAEKSSHCWWGSKTCLVC